MMSEDIASSQAVRRRLQSTLAEGPPTRHHGLQMDCIRRWD
jgi:hypothetical protein